LAVGLVSWVREIKGGDTMALAAAQRWEEER
jgi:hypothetical protein